MHSCGTSGKMHKLPCSRTKLSLHRKTHNGTRQLVNFLQKWRMPTVCLNSTADFQYNHLVREPNNFRLLLASNWSVSELLHEATR